MRLASLLLGLITVTTAPLRPSCATRVSEPAPPAPDHAPALASSTPTAPAPPDFVRVEEIAVPGDQPAYVLRGPHERGRAAVFLGGVCSHPQGYMQSFQAAAARYGELLGIQGNVSCGGAYRRWSADSKEIERRIDRAFAAAGIDPPEELTLIGYSQGAERAEWMHARSPKRMTRLVLIASPVEPSPDRLRGTRAVALVAGTLDLQTRMRDGATALPRHGITAHYFTLPGARHGEMGRVPEDSMGNVLSWLAAESGGR